MAADIQRHLFPGRLVMVGFGCVGQVILPLLLRHFEIDPQQINILSADAGNASIVQEFGVTLKRLPSASSIEASGGCRNRRPDVIRNLYSVWIMRFVLGKWRRPCNTNLHSSRDK